MLTITWLLVDIDAVTNTMLGWSIGTSCVHERGTRGAREVQERCRRGAQVVHERCTRGAQEVLERYTRGTLVDFFRCCEKLHYPESVALQKIQDRRAPTQVLPPVENNVVLIYEELTY